MIMIDTTNEDIVNVQLRYNTIRRSIEHALGPGDFTALRAPKHAGPVYSSWPHLYPLAWLPSVLADDYELNSVRVELIALNTDWVDIADWLRSPPTAPVIEGNDAQP